jgi:uncharacterized protein YndB with AHSA1/START domain
VIGSTTGQAAIALSRVFAAPRERVFRAWTDPAEVAGWWWPWSPSVEIDLRVGGTYRLAAVHPAAGLLAVTGAFREVRPPERLVYTWRWEGEADAAETLVTVEFRALADGATEVALAHDRFPSVDLADRHRQGWDDCLDRLEDHVRESGAPTR